MENCSVCSSELKFMNTPTFNNGKMKDGSTICTSCFKKVNNINPKIASRLKDYSPDDIKQIMQGGYNQIVKNNAGQMTSQQKIKTVAFILAAIFLIWIIFFRSSDEKPQEKYNKLSSLIDSRQFVEKQLKSPSTAKFSSEYENSVQQLNDTTFLITGFVDSQNSFGAMIRSNYSCKIMYLPSIGKVQCDNLVLE